jgi:hypothetical protein
VEELIEAYPDAKVVLTIRDREAWLLSMRKSILTILSWRSWGMLGYFDGFSHRYWTLLNYTTSVISKGIPAFKAEADPALRESFDEHIDKVRKLVPKDRLLEWHASHGWQPLCEFLDLPVPKEQFPHLNEPTTLVDIENIGDNVVRLFHEGDECLTALLERHGAWEGIDHSKHVDFGHLYRRVTHQYWI